MMTTLFTLFLLKSSVGTHRDPKIAEFKTKKECEIAKSFLQNNAYCLKIKYQYSEEIVKNGK